MAYTWLEFKTKVIEFLTVDGTRVGQTTFRDNLIRQAVIDIQSTVPFFRVGHSSTLGPDDVVVEQEASRGTLPEECQITRAWHVATGYGCSRSPVSSYDWANRYDLIAGAMTPGQYAIAINRDGAFYFWPVLEDGYNIVLEWDGLKLEFADTDAVPFTEEMARVASYFVKSHFAATVDNNVTMSKFYMDVERKDGLYYSSLRTLYRNATNRLRVKDSALTPQGQRRNEGVPVEDQNDDAIEFCIVGDSGDSSMTDTNAVAALVKALTPDFLIHTGDSNLPSGDPVNIWEKLQVPYGLYIPTKFWPAFGGNDVVTDDGAALLALFPDVAAANDSELYYSFTIGPVAFFVLNSGETGVTNQIATDAQATWLITAIAASDADWNIVVVHKAPYTSDASKAGGLADARLTYAAYGADLVVSGWSRTYERILSGGVTYLVNGLGGATKGSFTTPVTGSQVRYNSKCGCLKLSASATRLQVVFYDVNRTVIDRIAFTK